MIWDANQNHLHKRCCPSCWPGCGRPVPARGGEQSGVGRWEKGGVCPSQAPQEAKSPPWVVGPLECGRQEGQASLTIQGPSRVPTPSLPASEGGLCLLPPPALWGQSREAQPVGEAGSPRPLLSKASPSGKSALDASLSLHLVGKYQDRPWHLAPAGEGRKDPPSHPVCSGPKLGLRSFVCPLEAVNSGVTHSLSRHLPTHGGSRAQAPG